MRRRTNTTILLAIFGSLLCAALVSFNFDMPLDLLNGQVGDPGPMENAAQNGNVIRQVAVVSFAVLGLTVARGFSAIVPRPVGWLGAVSLAMLGWNCLSYVWADSPDIVVRRVIGLLLTAVGAMGISRLNWRDLRTVLTACLFLNLVVGIGNELILGTFLSFSPDYRFSGTLHPNFQAWNDAVWFCWPCRTFPRGACAGQRSTFFLCSERCFSCLRAPVHH